MSSFFEKLISPEEPAEKKPAAKAAKKNIKTKAPEDEETEETPAVLKKPKVAIKPRPEPQPPEEEEPSEAEEEAPEKTPEAPTRPVAKSAPRQNRDRDEGQLSIDVFQTDDEVIVQTTIAGVKPQNLEVLIENGMVKIFGSREKTLTVEKADYLLQECHWGGFSRQFVLPCEVDPNHSQASLKDGILTVRIPRIQKEKTTKLEIR